MNDILDAISIFKEAYNKDAEYLWLSEKYFKELSEENQNQRIKMNIRNELIQLIEAWRKRATKFGNYEESDFAKTYILEDCADDLQELLSKQERDKMKDKYKDIEDYFLQEQDAEGLAWSVVHDIYHYIFTYINAQKLDRSKFNPKIFRYTPKTSIVKLLKAAEAVGVKLDIRIHADI